MGLDYQVAIPSYGRHRTIGAGTLATLERAGVDKDRITIFVPSEAQKADYEETLGRSDYRLVVTAPGKFKSIQLAQEHYVSQGMEGTPVVQMDDDIYGLKVLKTDPKVRAGHRLMLYTGKLQPIVETGFGISETAGARLWGATIEARPKYMTETALVGNALIYGGLQGYYAGDPIFTGEGREYVASFEEDSETSLQAFTRYGAVVRLEYLSLVTAPPEPGGIQGELIEAGLASDQEQAAPVRRAQNLTAFTGLTRRYPQLVSVQPNSREGTMELVYTDLGNVRIPRAVVESNFGSWEG